MLDFLTNNIHNISCLMIGNYSLFTYLYCLKKQTVYPDIAFSENNKLLNGFYVISELAFKTSILNQQKTQYVNADDTIKQIKIPDYMVDIIEEYKNSISCLC